MTTSMLTRDFDTFTFDVQGEIATLTLKGRNLFDGSGIFEMDQLASSFRECASDEKLKVIIVKKSAQKKDSGDYQEFVKRAARTDGRPDIYRMLNYYNRFIMEVYSQKRFVISVDSGNVVAQFFNLSLACDYRIVADDTVIRKEYLRNGVVPKGGATYFMSQIVGKQKAYEILLSERDIGAREAQDLGLVNEVVPLAELEGAVLTKALELAKLAPGTLSGIKSLMNYAAPELERYLAYENDVIVGIFRRLNLLR